MAKDKKKQQENFEEQLNQQAHQQQEKHEEHNAPVEVQEIEEPVPSPEEVVQEAEDHAQAQADKITALQAEVAELKDKYVRLYADFDNFRKRTNKEKTEFLQQANAQLIKDLLPIVDDFERALQVIEQTESSDKIKEGIELIYKKFMRTLEKYGVKPLETPAGTEFNADLHEAITQAPAPHEELKGKIIDTIEKGYYLHDKVLRFAKVVVGS
jgi:molecular chaperone GrpE